MDKKVLLEEEDLMVHKVSHIDFGIIEATRDIAIKFALTDGSSFSVELDPVTALNTAESLCDIVNFRFERLDS